MTVDELTSAPVDARATDDRTATATATDEARVTTLVRRFGPRVLAYLARRVAVREDAADLFAETLATVWRRRAELPDDDEQAFAWMIGVARHTLLNSVRATARRHALVRRLRDDLVVRAARTRSSELGDTVRRALERLLPDDQEILRLDAWEGLTGDQIAAVLGITPAAARQRLSRARARLRAELASH